MSDKGFTRQVVVISGGSGGIGGAAAEKFLNAGAKVIVAARNLNRLKAKTKQLSELGTCGYVAVDIQSISSVKSAVRWIVKKYGRIDVLINAAAFLGPVGEFHKNNLSLWHQTIAADLLGTVNFCHASLPYMIKQKRGKIINFAGGGAATPRPNFSAYATAKAGVVRFTENLAEEYKAKNIQINVIAPGAVNTKFLTDALKAGRIAAGPEYQKLLEQKRGGGDSPEPAAELAFFLARPDNKLTGKFLSAKWDPWQSLAERGIKELNSKSDYTLRRIDNKYFKAIR